MVLMRTRMLVIRVASALKLHADESVQPCNRSKLESSASFLSSLSQALQKINIDTEIPFFEESKIKVPAGWLIEKLNWKGYKEKTCGVYAKHALAIVA